MHLLLQEWYWQEREMLAGEHFLHLHKERLFHSVAQGQRVPSVSGMQAEAGFCTGWFSLRSMNISFTYLCSLFHWLCRKSNARTIISGGFFFFFNEVVSFCSTCLNGKSANNLNGWRRVRRSITPYCSSSITCNTSDRFLQSMPREMAKKKLLQHKRQQNLLDFCSNHWLCPHNSCVTTPASHFGQSSVIVCQCFMLLHWRKQ